MERRADKWGVDDYSQRDETERQAYKKGFNAGKNYIKDNVKLTVSNDAIASSYQTLRHYRENLIKWLEEL